MKSDHLYGRLLQRLRDAATPTTTDEGKLCRAALERAEIAEARASALRQALADVLPAIDTKAYLTPDLQEALRRARRALDE